MGKYERENCLYRYFFEQYIKISMNLSAKRCCLSHQLHALLYLNKFQQVSSDHHQMSLAGMGPQVWSPGGGGGGMGVS